MVARAFDTFVPRGHDFGINQQLSVRAGEHRDIASGSQQDADVPPKGLHRDPCGGGPLEGAYDENVFGFVTAQLWLARYQS